MLHYLSHVRYVLSIGFATCVAAIASAGFALAAPSLHKATMPSPSEHFVLKVHSEHARHTRYRHHRIVNAPFTRVETLRNNRSSRRVVVDAPFTHVSVSRHGRRVIAPFVDLWLPH